jgi:hypothetical protein
MLHGMNRPSAVGHQTYYMSKLPLVIPARPTVACALGVVSPMALQPRRDSVLKLLPCLRWRKALVHASWFVGSRWILAF